MEMEGKGMDFCAFGNSLNGSKGLDESARVIAIFAIAIWIWNEIYCLLIN